MKTKCLLIAALCFLCKLSVSQDKPEILNAHDIIQKGIDFYDTEKYQDALKEFLKIPENDTAYFEALTEEVLTYYQLEQYNKGIAAGKKALGLNLYLSPILFLNLGSCYDNVEKYAEAVQLYDEGIKLFPKYNTLFFNKAFSLIKLNKDKEAFEYYKKSAELNPFHPGTHYALGLLAMNEGKTSLAMLAFSTYILLAPNAANANNALVLINEMSSSKYQDEIKSKGIDITDGDDFSDIDVLMQNYVALDKKYKVKSKVKLNFVKQFHLIFEKLPENPDNKGFWYRLYVPFYKQVMRDNKFDLFANYLLIASANENHKKTVEKNKSKLLAFTDWIRENWDNQHRNYEMVFNGKMQKVDVFRANKRYIISSIGTLNSDKTHYIGYSEIYHENGRLKAYGKWNKEGKKDGEWIWYYDNGNLKSKETYVDGQISIEDSYSFIGIIDTHAPFKNDKVEGEGIVYTSEGAKDKLITLKESIKEGKYEEYYSNGQVSLTGNNKNGKLDGPVKKYYNSGELKAEVNYLDGDKNSQEIDYYRNGKVWQKANYEKGKLQGIYVSYFKNGKLSDSIKYLNGKPIGKNYQYHTNGVIAVTSDFDENGKLNGIYREYDDDGKLYFELEYKKGEIIAYKYYNKKGEIIKQDKKRSGNFDFEGCYYTGIKRNSGKYNKEDKQGEWKFYDVNGNIESISNFKDGKAEGETRRFFQNGNVSSISQYKDDLADGYSVEYHKNGNIAKHGNYKTDNKEGVWEKYYPDKTLESENYYIGGQAHGTQKYYAVNGKITETISSYKGVLLNSVNFDTTGTAVDTVIYVNASGKRIYHFYKDGPVKCDINIQYNSYNGDYLFYFPNGKIRIKGKYSSGLENGEWIWYYWNGEISSKGTYDYGDKTGKWEYYNEDGKLNRVSEYENDKKSGKEISYYENGKIENERFYRDGLLEGTANYYSNDGQPEHRREYLHDQLISYTYFDAAGKAKTIEVVNETAEIKIYFKNGKLARQFTINKGMYQGEYDRYYPSGQIYEKGFFKDDDATGEDIFYHPNGKVKEKRNYTFGDLNGPVEEFYADGKVKEKSNYVFDNLHGKCSKYDRNGKLIAVLTYYDGELVSINEK